MSLNVPTTLIVSCTGSTTGYWWHPGDQNSASCPAAVNTGNSQMAVSGAGTAVSNCVYLVDVSGSLGAATATIALSWNAGGGSPPSGCSLTPASQTVTGGGVASLSAQCSGGTFPITHTLSSSGAFNGQSAVQTSAGVPATFSATVSAATTVTGTASNGQTASDGSATISIGGGGGGGGGFANCTRLGYTAIPGARRLASVHIARRVVRPAASGSFGDAQAWVFTLNVPGGRHLGHGRLPGRRVRFTTYAAPCGAVEDAVRFRPHQGLHRRQRTGGGVPQRHDLRGELPGRQRNSFGDTGWLQAGTYYISVRNYSDFPLPNGSPSCGASNCGATYNYQPTQ